MVDARGLSCPIPVVMTLDEIKKDEKEIEVLVDSMVCVENISRLADSKNYKIETEEKDGEYILKLSRND